jgi:hypothetical protein
MYMYYKAMVLRILSRVGWTGGSAGLVFYSTLLEALSNLSSLRARLLVKVEGS